MKKLGFIGAIIALAIVAFLINKPSSTSPVGEVKSEKSYELSIGYSRLRISLPVFVAQEKGIFSKNGLDVDLKMYETAQPLMQALVEGQIDVAGYTALPITYNAMLRSKKDLYFISTMVEDEHHRISYLLKAKGAEINSIAELKGKKVGILPTIAYKAWLEALLEANDLEPGKDVVIQQMAPTLQAKALQNGGVDALFTNDPVATSAIQAGIAELISNEVELPKYIQNPFPFGSFNVSKEWADANKEIFEKIVKSLDEAIAFVNANPTESKLMMKKYMPDVFKEHVIYYPDALYLSSQESKQETFNKIAEGYLKIGIINSSINLDGLVIN